VDEAQPCLGKIFLVQLNFKTRGLELMRNQLYSDENVHRLLEDLHKTELMAF
jgi:hypothetical protein